MMNIIFPLFHVISMHIIFISIFTNEKEKHDMRNLKLKLKKQKKNYTKFKNPIHLYSLLHNINFPHLFNNLLPFTYHEMK